jgi:hypothetical protein
VTRWATNSFPRRSQYINCGALAKNVSDTYRKASRYILPSTGVKSGYRTVWHETRTLLALRFVKVAGVLNASYIDVTDRYLHVPQFAVLLYNVGRPVHMRLCFRYVRKVSCQATCSYLDVPRPMQWRLSECGLECCHKMYRFSTSSSSFYNARGCCCFVGARATSTPRVWRFVAVKFVILDIN